MKLRETEFYGLLLIASAGLAWWSYHQPEPPQKSEASEAIELWSATGELRGLRFERQRLTVDVDGDWAETTRQRLPRKAAPQTDGGPAAEPEPKPEPEVRRFLINQKARDLLETLAKLEAKRNLGSVAKDRLEALGFGPDQGRLTLRFAKGERSLLVGEKDVSGRLRYVKLADQEPVYVIDNRLMTDLEFADSRLMEADLLPFDLAAVDAFAIESPWGGAQRWTRSGKEFAQEGDETIDPKASTWITKFFRLKAMRYLAAETPPSANSILQIQFETKEESGSLQLSREGEGKEAEYRITGGEGQPVIKVSPWIAKDLEADLPELLPRAETPPQTPPTE
ncbi:MAG: hypothetical protein CMH55_09275 [Myxococcales bacterium]|nr:hypothetical protein [Myxococcales bacterium]